MSNATLQLGGGNFAVKDGKLLGYATDPKTSVFVSREFDFSRGSNLAATRVDANGLIEKGRENLLLQSNQFDTTWITAAAGVSPTLTSGQSGYDGSNNAWLLNKSAVAFSRVEQSASLSGVWTFSVYAKAGTLDIMRLRDSTNASAAEFNLTSGTANPYGSIAQSITSVGSGWYRCSATFSSSTTQVSIYLQWNQADAGNIYIQDAQLEAGLVATDYIETGATTAQAGILENMPRIDYTNSSSPALLLEPQRTNLLPHSEWIGGWASVNDATKDAPQEFTLGSTGARIQAGSIGSPSGNFVFYAVFDSADIGKTIKLSYYDASAGGWDFGSDITIDSNGRAERLISTGSNVIGNVAFCGASASSQSFTLKYCQFEAGSYPTSYIPTYGTAVTRSNEQTYKTSATNLIGQTEGTMYAEFSVDRDYDGTQRILMISNGSNTERIGISIGGTGATGTIYGFLVDNNTTQASIIASGQSQGTHKAAFAYKENDFVFYLDGVQIGTDNGGTICTTDRIDVGRQWDGESFGGDINQALVFKTRLSNADLATLTTP